jgi:hypothetical protein
VSAFRRGLVGRASRLPLSKEGVPLYPAVWTLPETWMWVESFFGPNGQETLAQVLPAVYPGKGFLR